MRWQELLENEVPKELLDALDQWMHHYSKAHVWNGGNNDLCRRIVELAKPFPPKVTGWLYRGTGIEDELAETLAHGQSVELPATAKLLSSWTTYQYHADGFAEDAAEDNMSAVVLRLPPSRLSLVIDMALLYDAFP